MERPYPFHDSPQNKLAELTLQTMELVIQETREDDPHSVLNVLRMMVGLPTHDKEDDFLVKDS